MTAHKHLARAAIFLLLLLSPVGAPVVGTFISSICPFDSLVVANGPFALPFAYCGINRPAEHLYQGAVMLSLMPMVLAGPLVGGPLVMVWWLLSLASAGGCLWHLWRALAAVTIERL